MIISTRLAIQFLSNLVAFKELNMLLKRNSSCDSKSQSIFKRFVDDAKGVSIPTSFLNLKIPINLSKWSIIFLLSGLAQSLSAALSCLL